MPNLVTGLVMEDDSISSEKIATGNITNEKLASNSIYKNALQDDSINSDAIGTEAVVTSKFASSALSGGHFQDASITAEKLAEALFVTDGIIMWPDPVVPDGWVVCDGTNDTPDLRNCFLTFTDAGPGGQNIINLNNSGEHTHSGTTDSAGLHNHGNTGLHALQGNEIPPHRHQLINSNNSDGGWTAQTNAFAVFGYAGSHETYRLGPAGGEPNVGFTSLPLTSSGAPISTGQGHSHPISNDGLHSHTINIVSNGAHSHTLDVRPKYIVLKFIKKI